MITSRRTILSGILAIAMTAGVSVIGRGAEGLTLKIRTAPASKSAETPKSSEAPNSAATPPANDLPSESMDLESKATDGAKDVPSKPATKPADTKASANRAETKPAETKPAEPKAAAQKSGEAKPAEMKSGEPAKLAEPRRLDLPAPAEKVHPRKELAPGMAALRDRVRRTLVALRQQPFNTRDNTCVEVMEFCRAFGCEATISDGGQSGQQVNGITCLCWNMPCWGFEPLTVSEGHLAPRVGYGYQDVPSQLAAVLAMACVPLDYPARSGRVTRNVADLIAYEKLTCRAGSDMSLKLIALSYYVSEPSWKDNYGETWTIHRMVKEELDRPVGSMPHAGTSRLLGLAFALEQAARTQRAIDGDLLRARQYVDESIDYTLRTQNTDGSWGRITNRDYPTALSSTGRMLEWLVVAVPDERLEDPAVVRSVDFTEGLLSSQHYRGYVHSLSSREIAAVMHSAHALAVYDQRVFAPADPMRAAPEKSAEGSPAPTVRQTSAIQGQ